MIKKRNPNGPTENALRLLALLTEGDGLFWWKIDHDEAIGTSFKSVLDGLLFSIRKHGIIVTYHGVETRRMEKCVYRRTHEKDRSSQTLATSFPHKAQAGSIVNIVRHCNLCGNLLAKGLCTL